MTTNYLIRLIQPSDSKALMTLEDKTTDTGRVGFKARYLYDYYPIQQALRHEFAGFVAVAPETEELVGVGMMSFGNCQVEGEVRPYAYLGGLGVHEDFRRKGIASALAARRIELARQRIGPGGIIFAGIQGGNEGSLRTALKWANQKLENRNVAIIGKMKNQPPKPMNGLTVRPAAGVDLEEIAHRQNAFYREANLYPQKMAGELQGWLAERPFGHEINRYYVTVDRQGNILAGIGATLEGFLMATHIARLPWILRAANVFFQIVPADGITRRLNGHWFWFQPGQERAGTCLWDSIRWLERENATLCMLFHDPAGPVRQAITPSRFPPPSSGYILIHSPVKLSESRNVYFNSLHL
jgi:GNAT superfamily N-acetyltransferase